MNEIKETFQSLSAAVQNGDTVRTKQFLQSGLDHQLSATDLLSNGLLAGMNIVGQKFKAGEIFIPEVLLAARAMNIALEILEPFLVNQNHISKGILLIGTVQGDMHNIGKSLAAIMFKGAGFKIIDLGVNVSMDRFLKEIQLIHPNAIGLSAMLTSTMINMEPITNTIRQEFPTLPVVIGGAPTSQEFADSIGAHCWARSAMDGVEKITSILKNQSSSIK